MKIHAIGHNHSRLIGGVVTHATNFFKALDAIVPLVQSPIVPDEPEPINAYDADVHINLTLKQHWDLLNGPKFTGYKIAYPVFEWTNTKDMAGMFATHDQIWVATHWHKSVLEADGHDARKIKIIPEGVDPDVFNPNAKPNKQLANLSAFKFLCIARPDVRKNWPLIFAAFLEEFSDQEDVLLVTEHIAPNIKLIRNPRIVHVNPIFKHAALAPLYTACDAFVLPAKAEGWGLPICEAMACGLPVITTNYSGMTEFCNEANAYFVNHTLEEMPEAWNDISHPGTWAAIDKEHLKKQMRYVYEHREEAKEKGHKASKYILENFTWERAAHKAKAVLDSIGVPIVPAPQH